MARAKSTRSIAADIDRTYRESIRLIEESMQGLAKNSRAYLDRINARSRLFQQWRDERVSRGLDVQNLGMAIKPKFDFVAIIAEAETPQSPARKAWEDALDAEYPSPEPQAPAIPAAKKTKSKGKQ